jgi:hypothetical protein
LSTKKSKQKKRREDKKPEKKISKNNANECLPGIKMQPNT